MNFLTLIFSLFIALVAAQDTSSVNTRTVTSTLTSTYVSTCTVLLASTDAPKPSAVMGYPLTNGTTVTTAYPTATNPSGTVIKTAPTNTPYPGAAVATAPQALFALAAGVLVLVASS